MYVVNTMYTGHFVVDNIHNYCSWHNTRTAKCQLDLHAKALIKSKPYTINHRWKWVGPTDKRATPPSPSSASCRFSSKTTMRPRKAHIRLAGRQNFARANSRRRPPQECFGWG